MSDPTPTEIMNASRMAKYRATRAMHEQRMAERLPPQKDFEGTQFVGFMRRMYFDDMGGVGVTFVVPAEYMTEALELGCAYEVPLSVDVQVWKNYRPDE